jgi:hypothetical protein
VSSTFFHPYFWSSFAHTHLQRLESKDILDPFYLLAKSVVISRNVIFHEHIFSYAINQDHLFSKMTSHYSFVNHINFMNIRHSVFYSSHSLNLAFKNQQDDSWIIDTVATDHMVNIYVSYFTTISAASSSHVKLPN